MKKIYEYDPGYSIFRFFADHYIKDSFRFVHYLGTEKVPKEGSIIYAPNHCDALMDPLAVVVMDFRQKVFVARADIFEKPMIRKILTFFKIMPINRVRDGLRSVLRTEDTIEKSIEVLNNMVPFCILPEGMHRSKHSLLPMGKGLSRIAMGADKQREGTRGHIYIVPVGLEYGDYFRYRSSLLLQVGDPIDVTVYRAEHPDKNDPQVLGDLRQMTSDALRDLIVYIPFDEDYEPTWELAKLASGSIPEYRLTERKEANREAVARVQKLRESAPEEAKAFFERTMDYADARRAARVSSTVTHARRPLLSALLRTLGALLWLPFALVLCVLSAPSWITAEVLASGVKDPAFRNSFRCVAIMFTWMLMLVIYAVVLLCTVKWYWALAAFVAIFKAPQWTYDWFEGIRRLASAWRWASNGKLRRHKEHIMEEMKKYGII
ncbi:MAG: 1-acyl-sn-glycerol-3-phosphate acyltransferase [Bacteroidales bacterium]|nr:1-acyl-sn-glycerol-3-phosphate acyltransferase [Bacteroidales bacterium]